MFKASYRVATIWGIPIKVNISVIFLVLLLLHGFGAPLGILIATGILVSISLHELGHSFVALRKGCRVKEITLTCIGGVAQMTRMPEKPLDEFLMAGAGPLVSLGVGAICLTLERFIPIALLREATGWLGRINIVWVGFNLIPAFPMDGGRILRSLLTPKFGRLRATEIAAKLGQFLAIVGGILALTATWWTMILIAFFVYVSAGNEYRMVQMQEAAKQQGFGSNPWESFGFQPPPPPTDSFSEENEVSISPPPYKRGPGSKASIRKDKGRNPFKNLFD